MNRSGNSFCFQLSVLIYDSVPDEEMSKAFWMGFSLASVCEKCICSVSKLSYIELQLDAGFVPRPRD